MPLKGTYKHSLETRAKLKAARNKRITKTTTRLIYSEKFKGDKNPRWNGGIKRPRSGYILIASPDHPYGGKGKYIQEHRLMMEQHLGRYLKPEEIIHHINGIRSDNRIDNLMLFPSNSAHVNYHVELKKKCL